MKLTHLEIQGFKSFADRVKLKFDDGITGIVGPNGCGKSNVVDAIRWVLGEQRTRNLRSDKMENVIFNGTDKRKRAAMAEVSITFENTRNLLPTEYSTVSITRRLYQGGESEYLLNGVACRLKDITNLFLDTGIGPDSYAIIELGMVEDLLTDKNNARRQLFEEAAGISKYKLRKKETFARLGETEQSLERVEDLLHEIDKNLKSLEKQAKRAREYNELKEQYRTSSTQLGFLKLQDLKAQHEGLHGDETRMAEQLAGINSQVAQLDARLQELGKEILEREQALAGQQRELNAHADKIKTRESEHALRSERARYLTERRTQLEALLGSETDRRATIQANLAKLEGEIDQANEGFDKQEFLLGELDGQLEEARLAYQNRRQQLEKLQGELRGREQALQNLQRDNERQEVQLQALRNELNRSQQERQASTEQSAGYTERMTELRAAMATAEGVVDGLRRDAQHYEENLENTARRIAELREEGYQVQRQLDAKQQEYDLTKGLVDSLEGFSESVRWLKKNATWAKDTPLVSDLFFADVTYKVALETALEPWLNHYVVPDRAHAVAGATLLKDSVKGRANFFILDEIAQLAIEKATLPAGISATPLLSLVEVSSQYQPLARYLLGNVFVAEAAAEEAALPEGIVIVAKDGTRIARRGVLSGGSVGLFEGKRVGRAKALEKLQPEIDVLRKQHQQLQASMAEQTALQQALASQNPAQKLQEAEKEFQLLFRQLSVVQAKEDEYQNFLNRIRLRSDDLEGQMQRLTELLAEARPRQDALHDEVSGLLRQLEEQQREATQRERTFNELQQRHNQENISFLNLKNQVQSLKKDFAYQREQLERITEEADKQKAELKHINQELEQLSMQGNSHDTAMVELYETRQRLEQALQAREEALIQLKQRANDHNTNQRQLRQQRDELQQQAVNLKDRATEIRIQQNGLRERLQVEFMIDLHGIRPESVFDAPLETYSLVAVEKTVMGHREKLQAFGPVNTTAIEAFEEIQERHVFITTQRNDLLEAKTNLMSTIQEMDETAKAKFQEAFTQIRENFITVFRTLFTDQDSCDLLLVRPDDPLESPIEIMARPKGKRPLTINQLSGGEKTLTATSLLFAIYLLKPAPFCIFDEVDAPLDDANVDKFTNIIEEFSANSQFVVVTHNKRTMAKTRILYGVTMEETGVSRVLPVDLVSLNLN